MSKKETVMSKMRSEIEVRNDYERNVRAMDDESN